MTRRPIPAFCGSLVLLTLTAAAQRPGRESDRSEALQTIAQKTAGMKKYEGFLDFYWEEGAEKIWVEVADWNQQFLYVTSTPSSVAGRNRGSWGRTRVLEFSREGAKVFLIESDYSYRAESDDPLERRAVAEAYTPSIIAGFSVGAAEADAAQEGRVLIDFTDFLMKDGTRAADRARSAFYWPRPKNFPKNTEIEVTVTTNAAPGADGGRGSSRPGGGRGGRGRSTDSTTVRAHHSFIELPDANYRVRNYDRRAGGMSVSFRDYATPLSEPLQKRYAARHRLVKKDPSAAVSEVTQPLVYHVDPGAPEPIRSALVEGASWWNEAFEAIGFENAFRVEVLPADVDPMDLRYNLILWTHRPNRGWSSGSSVRDPRTGEIIAGRVFLGSQRVRQDFMIGAGLMAPYESEQANTKAIEEMVLARVRQLSAHEVGHTLGFGHNFAASTMGRASVMDYPHPVIKIREDGSFDTSDAYDVGIGDWDKVMIAYAYSQFPAGVDESQALNDILDKAHERGLFFLGAVGSGSSSPHTTQWDNGRMRSSTSNT